MQGLGYTLPQYSTDTWYQHKLQYATVKFGNLQTRFSIRLWGVRERRLRINPQPGLVSSNKSSVAPASLTHEWRCTLQVGQHLHNTDRKPVSLYEPVTLANSWMEDIHHGILSHHLNGNPNKNMIFGGIMFVMSVFQRHFDWCLDFWRVIQKRLSFGDKTLIVMKTLSQLRTYWASAECCAVFIEALCLRVWILPSAIWSIPLLWWGLYFVHCLHIIFLPIYAAKSYPYRMFF